MATERKRWTGDMGYGEQRLRETMGTEGTASLQPPPDAVDDTSVTGGGGTAPGIEASARRLDPDSRSPADTGSLAGGTTVSDGSGTAAARSVRSPAASRTESHRPHGVGRRQTDLSLPVPAAAPAAPVLSVTHHQRVKLRDCGGAAPHSSETS